MSTYANKGKIGTTKPSGRTKSSGRSLDEFFADMAKGMKGPIRVSLKLVLTVKQKKGFRIYAQEFVPSKPPKYQ